MQIVREIGSKKAVYLFDDNAGIALSEDGLQAPEFTVIDIASATHEIVTGDAPDVWLGGALAYDAGVWSVIDQAALDAAAEAARIAAVPVSVLMRQARLALLAADLLDDVDAFIATLPRSAQVEWEFAAEVRRDHAVVSAVQAQQGWTDRQTDDFFAAAGNL